MSPFSKAVCVLKQGEQRAASLCSIIASFLSDRGIKLDSMSGETAMEVDNVGLVLALGGDGTFISAARKALPHGVPVLGVNLGRVGFLASLSPDCWQQGLEQVLAGKSGLFRRLALQYEIVRGGRTIHSGIAVNDLVISRGELARLVRLGVSLDGEQTSLRADGLIVTTPNGSSAYCVSAGGPLLHPDIPAYALVPVCPFLGSFKPLVLPQNTVCEIGIEEANGPVNITEDGQGFHELAPGDIVRIIRSAHDLLVVDLGERDYLGRLARKGFMTEG